MICTAYSGGPMQKCHVIALRGADYVDNAAMAPCLIFVGNFCRVTYRAAAKAAKAWPATDSGVVARAFPAAVRTS
jgi:hypothetical protein